MPLPNLSNLDISAPEDGVTLFEHLAERNSGYLAGCKKHYDQFVRQPSRPTAPTKPTEPRKPDRSRNVSNERMNRYNERYESYKNRMKDYQEDYLDYQQAMAKYKQDASLNCANHGYYMYKHVEGAQTDGEEYLGKTITLRSDNPDQPVNFIPFDRGVEAKEKARLFEEKHPEWVKDRWNIVCQNEVFWKLKGEYEYALSLTETSDWYYLDDDEKKGHIFVTLVDEDFKDAHLYPNTGVFKGNYLFIQLVCAAPEAKGFGTKMLEYVEELSKKLGCTGIALASLATPAGFYYSRGYRFMNSDGFEIKADAWTKEVVRDGSVKVMLLPYEKVDTNDDKRYREDDDEEEGGEEGEMETHQDKKPKRWSAIDRLSYFLNSFN